MRLSAPVASFFFIAIFLLSGQELEQQQASRLITITVNTGRPLAGVLDRVQQQLLSPINYEEAPYESPTDLKSITVTQDNGPKVLLALPVVDFSVTLDSGDSTSYLAAQSVLGSYVRAGLPGMYKVVQQNNRVDVVPVSVLSASGSMRQVTPVMSSTVTFPLAERSAIETVQMIAESISRQSGAKVIPLNLPFGLLETVELGANGESAGDVIENLGAKVGGQISYQCLYDATSKTYYPNLKTLNQPSHKPSGLRHNKHKEVLQISHADAPFDLARRN